MSTPSHSTVACARSPQGRAVRHLRVLVVGATSLIHDIVTNAVTSEQDMSLLPESVMTNAPLSAAQRFDAEVIVYLLDDASRQRATESIHELFPRRAVVAVDRGGERVWLYDYGLRLDEELRGDLSPQMLL